jgi:hypothetical protein
VADRLLFLSSFAALPCSRLHSFLLHLFFLSGTSPTTTEKKTRKKKQTPTPTIASYLCAFCALEWALAGVHPAVALQRAAAEQLVADRALGLGIARHADQAAERHEQRARNEKKEGKKMEGEDGNEKEQRRRGGGGG